MPRNMMSVHWFEDVRNALCDLWMEFSSDSSQELNHDQKVPKTENVEIQTFSSFDISEF